MRRGGSQRSGDRSGDSRHPFAHHLGALIVTVKYVLILLRADNNGEGGTLALMAFANRTLGGKRVLIVMLGMISAALFYGDAMITPALSVLSAVEGLEVIRRRSGALSCRYRS